MENRSDVFSAIAGGQKKNSAQLKHDLETTVLLSDFRTTKGDKLSGPRNEFGEKQFFVSGVSVSAEDVKEAQEAEARAAIASVRTFIPPPPRSEDEKKQDERDYFKKKFGVDFDEAIEHMIAREKREKNKILVPKSEPLGPSEGSLPQPKHF
jgi:hypothetical protein